jgi:hypothetical protein
MIKGVLNYAYWNSKKSKMIFRIKEELHIDLPDGSIINIPIDYETDFATIPWWFRGIIPTIGRHAIPALVHDFLYDNRIGTRKEADLIFYKLMRAYHVDLVPALTMYFAVRLGARKWWRD